MTVKEVRERLASMPDDAVVMCHTWDGLWRELEWVGLEKNGTVSFDADMED